MSEVQFASLDAATQQVLRKVHKTFKDADNNGNGRLELHEFAKAFELEENIYTRKLYSIFDKDDNGDIDFKEFLVGMARFGAEVPKGGYAHIKFAFQLFDLDNSGTISKQEIGALIREVEGIRENTTKFLEKKGSRAWGDQQPLEISNRVKKYDALLNALKPKQLEFTEFLDFAHRIPDVMVPAKLLWISVSEYAKPAYLCVQMLYADSRYNKRGNFDLASHFRYPAGGASPKKLLAGKFGRGNKYELMGGEEEEPDAARSRGRPKTPPTQHTPPPPAQSAGPPRGATPTRLVAQFTPPQTAVPAPINYSPSKLAHSLNANPMAEAPTAPGGSLPPVHPKAQQMPDHELQEIWNLIQQAPSHNPTAA